MRLIDYRVNTGDTLFTIARRHHVTVEVLSRLNGLSELDRIWAGQVLKIPKEHSPSPCVPSKPVTDRVRAGDTLSKIAQRNNVTVEALVLANHLKEPYGIAIGQSLKVPKMHSFASQAQTKSINEPGAKTAMGVLPENSKEPTAQTQTSMVILLDNSKEIGSFGRVRNDDGVNLRAAPSGTILKRLSFNTRVFVSRELPGGWYFVTLDDGSFGYVYSKYVSINPPEPGAVLHKIMKGESALQIVKQYYKSGAISWGQDERYYVNVLVEANRSKSPSGIYKPDEDADWSKTQTREAYLIWIPSLDFAKSLRGKVSSGSISYEVWEAAKYTATTVGDFFLSYAAFVAGLLHGALESVWDLLTGLVDLVELIWDILKSIFTGELLSDLKGLWELVGSLNPSQLIDAGINAFLSRWDASDFLRKWHFRGWVVGYALAEILMAVISGAATLVKWAGKAGKFSKLIAKFPRVLKLAERAAESTKRISEDTLKRIKKVVSKAPEETPSRQNGRVPWTGARYAEDVDPADAMLYESIRKAVNDTLDIARCLKIKQSVLDRVKEHLFHRVHELPIGPGKTVKANFSPDPDIADLWVKATKGKLSVYEVTRFRRLIAHEYVESRLMEKGLPYRSSHPEAYRLGYNMPTPSHHGAHDLAPIVDAARAPFGHWEKMLGRKPPEFEFVSDLSNLEKLVDLIWRGEKK